MLTVDNSGRGNCMYYAYSISLMYILRSKDDPQVTESVFNKLKLSDSEKMELNSILSKNPAQEISTSDIKKYIEPIMGTAARNLVAEQTKEAFKKSPTSTELFTSIHYGLEFHTKQKLRESFPDLSKKIDNNFKNETFTKAEIYRVSQLKMDIVHRSHKISSEFQEKWINIPSAERDALRYEETIKRQMDLLDSVIREHSTTFFLENDEQRLTVYSDHLKKEFVWADDASLNLLHSVIQGEYLFRNPEGLVETRYDVEIPLRIYQNGQLPYPLTPKQREIDKVNPPLMILDNRSGIHWVSKIPDCVTQEIKQRQIKERATQRLKQEQIQQRERAEARELAAHPPQKEIKVKLAEIAELNTRPQPEAPEVSLIIPEPTVRLEQIQLEAKERFENHLKQLDAKVQDFNSRIKELKGRNLVAAAQLESARDAAFYLRKDLTKASEPYYSNPTEESYKQFQKECNDYIKQARPTLETHRGWKQILGNIGLAILGLGVLYLAAAGINKALNGNFLFFKTKSAEIVDNIENNVNQMKPVK
jgi:hypothetical protein